jgi:cytochrome c biogenesis protein CcmG/thiol:disulfide interchange protein DsbE
MDFGVTGTPDTFVIDKLGIVRMKHIGQITVDVWRNKFVPLINRLNK